MPFRLLFVEDDADFGFMLKQYLEYADFLVDWFDDPRKLHLDASELRQYDLAILDVMMPTSSGFHLGQELRQVYPELPLIFLTAKDQKIDRLTGLKIGADDYLSKPCDPEELILRIQNIIKRSKPHLPLMDKIVLGTYLYYPNQLILEHASGQQQLTEREAKLLSFLISHKEELISREAILEKVWDNADFFSGRSMDVFISRLRKYLIHDPSLQIQSIRSVGFKVRF